MISTRKILAVISFLLFQLSANGQRIQWENIGNAPFSKRDGVASLVFKDKIWLLGGWDPERAEPLMNEVWSSSDGVNWIKELENAEWLPRHCAGFLVFQDKMWIMSGDGRNDVWYSEDGKKWIQAVKNAPWGERYKPYVVEFKGKMWLIGGLDQANNYKAKNDVWSSVDGIQWELESDGNAWSPRGIIHGGVVFNDKLWLMGGGLYGTPPIVSNEVYYNDVWSTEDGIHWEKVLDTAPWPARIHHTTWVYADRMWVFAGHQHPRYGHMNDVWYSKDGIHWQELQNSSWPRRHAASVFNFQGKLWMMLGYLHNDIWNLNISGLGFVTEPKDTSIPNSEYNYSSIADFQNEGDTVFYSLNESPTWISINRLTGELKGKTPCNFKDSVKVKIQAFTRKGESAIQEFYIHSERVPQKVKISIKEPTTCNSSKPILEADTLYNLYYNWNTGQNSPELEVHEPGDYKLYFRNNYGCIDSSSTITIYELPYNPTSIYLLKGNCNDNRITLSARYNLTNYFWNTGDTTSFIKVSKPGKYQLYSRNSIGCLQSSNIIIITDSILKTPNLEILVKENTSIKKPIYLKSKRPLSNYKWSTGETTSEIKVTEPGEYFLYSVYENKCYDSSNVILIEEDPRIITDESVLRIGSTIRTQYDKNISWYKDSILISNESIFTIPYYGKYHAKYKGKSCTYVSEVIELIDASKFSKVEIFPNPIKDILNFQFSEEIRFPIHISIYSVTGRQMFSKLLSDSTDVIEISDFPIGLYHVVLSEKGNSYQTKFIKSDP